jgi:hypothetical protein
VRAVTQSAANRSEAVSAQSWGEVWRLAFREVWDYRRKAMIIALYIAAAVIMAVGSLYFAWRSIDFRKFLAGRSSYSISPMFRCLCWAQVLSRRLRSAVAAPSSISSSSCLASILVLLESQDQRRKPTFSTSLLPYAALITPCPGSIFRRSWEGNRFCAQYCVYD